MSYLIIDRHGDFVASVTNIETALPLQRAAGRGAAVTTEAGVVLATMPGNSWKTTTSDRYVPISPEDRPLWR